MIDETRMATLTGATVYGGTGDKIGKVEEIYLDDTTNRPEWLTVSTGMFGSKVSFVPIRAAEIRGDNEVVVPYDKAFVKGAPAFDVDSHLSVDEERQLYAYYDMAYADGGQGYGGEAYGETDRMVAGTGTAGTETLSPVAAPNVMGTPGTTGTRTAGAAGVDAGGVPRGTTGDDAMTRSEERMRVGTENVETGRARLRKYVVTENVTKTVPVRHEEVRVEREPITDANRGAAMSGPEITESEHEVTLHEERPVVETETVPVERVRLAKESRTDEETVTGELRKERIDEEGVYPNDAGADQRTPTDRRS